MAHPAWLRDRTAVIPSDALAALDALAQETRLDIHRLLVQAGAALGDAGLPPQGTQECRPGDLHPGRQLYFNAGLAYWLNRQLGVEWCVAGPSALIGTSDFFELAVATPIVLFGFQSGAALATVVGVLVEVR